MTDAAPDTGTDATDTSMATTTTAETGAEETTDWKAEAEKFKALARKQEDRAKANADAAKRLTELEREKMSDLEAAVDKAKADTRAEVLGQFGSKLATEAVRAAAAGRVADVDALLEGIDASKFLGDDGDPDRDAIAAWVDRIAPKANEDEQTSFVRTLDLGQGARGTTSSAPDPLEQALTAITHR